MSSKVLTIMFVDIAGYTAKSAAMTREELHNTLDTFENLLIPVISYYRGSLIKTIGDAILATFPSPTNAVLGGILMQEIFREYNKRFSEKEQILIRVAINSGEVEIRNQDVFGDPVNIASRLEGITQTLEVFFTEVVYLEMNKAEIPCLEVGRFDFKGVRDRIGVWKVDRSPESEVYQKLRFRLCREMPGFADLIEITIRQNRDRSLAFKHGLPDEIVQKLYSWDSRKRIEALDQIARDQNPIFIPFLQRFGQSEKNPAVIGHWMEAFSCTAKSQAISFLTPWLKSPRSDLREVAIRAVGNTMVATSQSGVLRIFFNFLADPEEKVVRASLRELERFVLPEKRAQEAAAYFQIENEVIALNTILFIEHFKLTDCLNLLDQCIRSEKPVLAQRARTAMDKIISVESQFSSSMMEENTMEFPENDPEFDWMNWDPREFFEENSEKIEEKAADPSQQSVVVVEDEKGLSIQLPRSGSKKEVSSFSSDSEQEISMPSESQSSLSSVDTLEIRDEKGRPLHLDLKKIRADIQEKGVAAALEEQGKNLEKSLQEAQKNSKGIKKKAIGWLLDILDQ